MIKLIPQPKLLEEKGRYIKYDTVNVNLQNTDERIKRVLEKLPHSSDGIEVEIIAGTGKIESYILDISEEKITIKSDGLAGAFYGIQTLRQIFQSSKIPCLHIEDCPDFKHRGVYHDITRGKIPKLETLKKLIDELAYYKINSFQIYVEHCFKFKEYEDSVENTGHITADEIRELDRYCTENFIEFIPSLSTFGHLYELLQKDRYKHLRVLENYEQEHIFWRERMAHHTIDPLNPESFEIIKSLIDQFLPLFSSDKFNICCDETFDLKCGKYKDRDTGRIYIDFVGKIVDYIKSKGKKVMMWGDILLEHPEYIDLLDKDVILLNWDYDAEPKKEKIERLNQLNRTQIVCPGTSGWFSLCEYLKQSVPNITNMVRYAYEHGAEGILNTNWGDYGNPCSIELEMYSLTYGAEKSWNVNSKTEEFEQKADTLVYKKHGASEYLKRISNLHHKTNWREFVHCYSNKLFEDQIRVDLPDENDILYVQKECEKIIDELKNQTWKNDEFRIEMLIATEGTQVLAELYAKHLDFDIKRITDTQKWLKKFSVQWKKKNKDYELCEIEKMFEIMDK
ncbi:MAG: family 20 glycosylhydrolase [Clostridia bacterium]|nr:family 20 glycosylhydrolase [Clostridia bacterium]